MKRNRSDDAINMVRGRIAAAAAISAGIFSIVVARLVEVMVFGAGLSAADLAPSTRLMRADLLDRNGEMASVENGKRQSDDRLPHEHHARWTFVIEYVREHVIVHEYRRGLANAEWSKVGVGVSQPERKRAECARRISIKEINFEPCIDCPVVKVRGSVRLPT